MNAPPTVDEASTDDAPLSEEQLALYRSRLESGYYRSPGIVKQIAEGITDELYPPEMG